METGEIKKYYQWKSGFRSGQVECYLAETETDIYFEGGSSIPKSQLDEQLVQITEEMYMERSTKAQSQNETMEAWKKMLGNDPIFDNPTTQTPPSVNQPIVEKSPVQIILEKQKKKEVRSLSIDVTVEIPNAKVMDLLTTMFDEDEVYDEIVNGILQKIDNEEIKNLINAAVIKLIKGTEIE